MNWKKAVSVMLVGIMALSMTACGDSGETSTDAASGGGSTAESTEGAGTSASGDDNTMFHFHLPFYFFMIETFLMVRDCPGFTSKVLSFSLTYRFT